MTCGVRGVDSLRAWGYGRVEVQLYGSMLQGLAGVAKMRVGAGRKLEGGG